MVIILCLGVSAVAYLLKFYLISKIFFIVALAILISAIISKIILHFTTKSGEEE